MPRPHIPTFSISFQTATRAEYVLPPNVETGFAGYTYPAIPSSWYLDKEYDNLDAARRRITKLRKEFGDFMQAQVHKTILFQDTGDVVAEGVVYREAAPSQVESCPKCGAQVTREHAFEDSGTGEESGRTFYYCSEHCRETH